ncbi:sulfatase-like hydrolase/transferase [Thalassoroseus pseudoceratinae]|uniref:sulfatase-like hydrolase/transferase n=1 Tax=Thalassoroseus pseudoceratinae TaxID=2713176 RepID=UPI001420B4BA|nr:sulfatase-like hydrolase/transferase [Thalassoroseus pseudoceratinae]
MWKSTFWLVLAVLFSLPCRSVSAIDRGPEHPNVILVFIDDMGWTDLSCFDGQGPRTQHIDQLASEGIRFTQFYVNSPICSPSRVAISTGQYPQRWRITSYLNNRRSNRERGMAQWLDVKAPMLARELQRAGYATGHFGKWHMGGQRDVDNAPPITAYGFDQSLTNFEGMGAKLLPLTMQPGWEKPGRIWQKAVRLGEPVTWMQRSEITGGFVEAALKFIDQAQADKKPFYVNVWPDDVHAPFFPPLEKWKDGRRALYHGVLDALDEQLAALFNRIRNDEELRRQTLIVLCSDNGHDVGAGSSDPLRGGKTWLYEGGIRSPLITWGPGLLAKEKTGTVNEESVFCALDLNRSLYDICHVNVPKNAKLDGENLAETLLGHSKQSRQSPIFWRRPPDRPGFGHGYDEDNPDLAVRDGQWKFTVNYDGSSPQLYDLSEDAAETNNLVDANPKVADRLHKAIREWNSELPRDAGDQSSD